MFLFGPWPFQLAHIFEGDEMMKLFFFTLVLFFNVSIHADEKNTKINFNDFCYYGGQVANIVDWLQIRTVIQNHNGEYSDRHELNPLLGKHPSMTTANIAAGSSIALHWYLNKKLKSPYREIVNFFWYNIETSVVLHNYQVGISIRL